MGQTQCFSSGKRLVLVQLFSQWLSVAVCFAAYVSTRNFTGLREITFFLIGSRLFERGRNLTVIRFFERQQQNSASRKDGDPHRHFTGTCRHVMEKHCRTDYQYENSCTARCRRKGNEMKVRATYRLKKQVTKLANYCLTFGILTAHAHIKTGRRRDII